MQFISKEKWLRFSRSLPVYFQGFVPKFFRVFKENYTFAELRRDLTAGITVAIVALPLSMALAIASGTTPDRGLFTAIVAGFIISFLGGQPFSNRRTDGSFRRRYF